MFACYGITACCTSPSATWLASCRVISRVPPVTDVSHRKPGMLGRLPTCKPLCYVLTQHLSFLPTIIRSCSFQPPQLAPSGLSAGLLQLFPCSSREMVLHPASVHSAARSEYFSFFLSEAALMPASHGTVSSMRNTGLMVLDHISVSG